MADVDVNVVQPCQLTYPLMVSKLACSSFINESHARLILLIINRKVAKVKLRLRY